MLTVNVVRKKEKEKERKKENTVGANVIMDEMTQSHVNVGVLEIKAQPPSLVC